MRIIDELIDALRFCADWNCSEKCPRGKADKDNPCFFYCKDGRGQKGLLYDAADAIERLQAENDELRARWNGAEICGYNAQYLIMFADACKRQHVTNDDLKQVADDLTWAVQTVYDAAKRAMENVVFKMTGNGCEANMKYIFPPPINPDRLKQMDFEWDISGCKSVKLSDIKFKETQNNDAE